jgi:RHS repeat-associated protein
MTHVTRFGYDSSGCLDTAKDAANRTTNFDCNAVGQITSVTDPLSHTTAFSYAQGDLISSTDPLGSVSSRLVDDGGRVLSVTDPLNYVTSYQYDKLNQLTKVTNAQAKAISFFYDPDGNLTQVKDERNATPSNTFFAYNNMNLVSTRTDPLSHVESFSYDDMGNPTFWTDRKSQVTEFQYDPLNRVKFAGFKRTGTNHITYESTINYSYDAGGRLTGIADNTTGAGTVTRGFNDLDQLISEISINSTAITYTYNPDGTRLTMTVPGQNQVTYGYNAAGQLTGLTQGGNTTAQDYFDDGRLRSITYPSTPGSLKQTFAYDVAGQVGQITYQLGSNPADDLSYSYDPAGRRTAVFGTYARTGLPAATTSNGVYDLANRLTSWNGSSVSNDLNGNMTSQGGLTYTYNARNQLTTAKQGSTTLGSFAYDGLGRRVSKTLSATLTKFVYDGLNPVQEKTSSNQVIANMLVGADLDQWFSRTPPTTGLSSYFLSDALGSTVAVTDSGGAVSTFYTYEPYGGTTVSGSSTNPFQFAGRENDSAGALSMYDMRARYYSPTLQRFVAEDPIRFAGGDTNLFEYVGANPANANDVVGFKGAGGWAPPSDLTVALSRKDLARALSGVWEGTSWTFTICWVYCFGFGHDPNNGWSIIQGCCGSPSGSLTWSEPEPPRQSPWTSLTQEGGACLIVCAGSSAPIGDHGLPQFDRRVSVWGVSTPGFWFGPFRRTGCYFC